MLSPFRYVNREVHRVSAAAEGNLLTSYREFSNIPTPELLRAKGCPVACLIDRMRGGRGIKVVNRLRDSGDLVVVLSADAHREVLSLEGLNTQAAMLSGTDAGFMGGADVGGYRIPSLVYPANPALRTLVCLFRLAGLNPRHAVRCFVHVARLSSAALVPGNSDPASEVTLHTYTGADGMRHMIPMGLTPKDVEPRATYERLRYMDWDEYRTTALYTDVRGEVLAFWAATEVLRMVPTGEQSAPEFLLNGRPVLSADRQPNGLYTLLVLHECYASDGEDLLPRITQEGLNSRYSDRRFYGLRVYTDAARNKHLTEETKKSNAGRMPRRVQTPLEGDTYD